jgi:hypothetical protein
VLITGVVWENGLVMLGEKGKKVPTGKIFRSVTIEFRATHKIHRGIS